MQKILIPAIFLLLASCGQATTTGDSVDTDTIDVTQHYEEPAPQADDIDAEEEPQQEEVNNTKDIPVANGEENDVPNKNTDSTIRTGRHSLTIQWISWDRPGTVDIKRARNGWYTVKGKQENPKNNDYVKIDGRIKPADANKLIFEGDVEYAIASIDDGRPCKKSGEQIFLSTRNRKYWRLQNMLHCVAGTTDYVDIYF